MPCRGSTVTNHTSTEYVGDDAADKPTPVEGESDSDGELTSSVYKGSTAILEGAPRRSSRLAAEKRSNGGPRSRQQKNVPENKDGQEQKGNDVAPLPTPADLHAEPKMD